MREPKKAFDFTAMSTFLTCRRKYDFRHNRGIVGKVAQTAPDFGKAIHTALDTWYIDKDIEKTVQVFKATFQENPDDDKRTHKMGEWILRNYHEQYKDQQWELVKTEHTFDVPLPNGNRFTGRIDKIIKWNGCLWIVDHKTTSMLGASYFNAAEPNMQFTGYAYAAKQEGYEVRGVIVDAILVAKGLLPGPSKSRTLTPLARYDIYYKEEHFQEWEDMVLKVQGDIKACEDAEGDLWYPNYTACIDFGECPYRRICKEEKSIRERIIQADYQVEHWDPLHK